MLNDSFNKVWKPEDCYFKAECGSLINIFKVHCGCLLLLFIFDFSSTNLCLNPPSIHLFPTAYPGPAIFRAWLAVLLPCREQSGQDLFYLSHLTICQNLFLANWKSFSMASLNSAHSRVLSLPHAAKNAVLPRFRAPMGWTSPKGLFLQLDSFLQWQFLWSPLQQKLTTFQPQLQTTVSHNGGFEQHSVFSWDAVNVDGSSVAHAAT